METLRFFSEMGARFSRPLFDCDSDALVRSALAALKLELSPFFRFFSRIFMIFHEFSRFREKPWAPGDAEFQGLHFGSKKNFKKPPMHSLENLKTLLLNSKTTPKS